MLIARHARLLASDACQAHLANPAFAMPDMHAMYRVGSSSPLEFLQTGFLLAATLQEFFPRLGKARVLDVGCGWGRLAIALAPMLGPEARYHGIDAAPAAIAWCRDAIAATDPRFRFEHIDARSSYANPSGRLNPEEILLGPHLAQFDIVVAASLFTHLLPGATRRYLREMARLCSPSGAVFATFFLLDPKARQLSAAGRSRHSFPHRVGAASLASLAVPEDAVAYTPAFVLQALREAGLSARIHCGAWSGRPNGFDYQDVVVARPSAAPAPEVAADDG